MKLNKWSIATEAGENKLCSLEDYVLKKTHLLNQDCNCQAGDLGLFHCSTLGILPLFFHITSLINFKNPETQMYKVF